MGEIISLDRKKFIKPLVFALGVLIIALILYLVVLPFYPIFKYKFFGKDISTVDPQNLSAVTEQTKALLGGQKAAGGNRLVIAKIGVNTPIMEGQNENALNQGAWRLPESSTPDKSGNTIITGHRFKYLPPNNLTFYLFDKLAVGDIFSIFWAGEEYYYRIREIKRVPAEETGILAPSAESIITLFTCDPIWSQDNRLVVIGEPVK